MRKARRYLPASILILAAACSSISETQAPVASGPSRKVDAATAGSVTGKVLYQGPPIKAEFAPVSPDPACSPPGSPPQPSEATLVGAAGEVPYAFVYVKDGLDPAYVFDAPTEKPVFRQRTCRYEPHVIGLQSGQALEIVNDDATVHNVHAIPKENREFNVTESVKGATTTQIFTAPETMVKVKCDLHPWMSGYVGVTPHPFHAVTAADGTFELKGLPPGTYTLEAWQERFGTQTSKVTIAPKQTQTVAFAFAGK